MSSELKQGELGNEENNKVYEDRDHDQSYLVATRLDIGPTPER